MEKKDLLIEELAKRLNNENKGERIAIFIWGVLIYAIAFSVFFSPRNIVTGGTTGLSLLFQDLFFLDPSVVVFVLSLFFLFVGYFLLGRENVLRTVCGVILLPIFMKFGSIFSMYAGLEDASLFLMIFFGGIFMGFGNGMIIRSGFSVGGFQTLYQILYKYFGISIGKSTLWINGIVIFVGGCFFGFTNALYAIIGLYISSVVTDKVMLETSISKTFFIVTDKEKEISQYVSLEMGYGVTVMDAHGGYTNDGKKLLMCAVPTRHYYQIKEVIEEIDEDVFFLITDTYEIYGGM